MVIVSGVFTVDADQRDAFLASRIDQMHRSRAERGCLEYTFCADPTDPERVLLVERWASQEDLDAHVEASSVQSPTKSAVVSPRSRSISVYDVTGERPIGN